MPSYEEEGHSDAVQTDSETAQSYGDDSVGEFESAMPSDLAALGPNLLGPNVAVLAAPSRSRANEPSRDPVSGTSPTVGNDPGAEPAVEDHKRGAMGRQIIYTATMAVSVFNVQDAVALAETLPERHDGWIAQMNADTLVIKIPSKNLRAAMDEIAAMGVVESRTLLSNDVSDRYYDLQTRIAVLEKTHAQMLALLSKARNVTEALSVRAALDKITMELEVLKGQIRKLKDNVSFSTLTLNLLERGPHDATPSSNDPFPWVDELGVEATEWR